MLLFFIYCKDIKIISYVQNQILAHMCGIGWISSLELIRDLLSTAYQLSSQVLNKTESTFKQNVIYNLVV